MLVDQPHVNAIVDRSSVYSRTYAELSLLEYEIRAHAVASLAAFDEIDIIAAAVSVHDTQYEAETKSAYK